MKIQLTLRIERRVKPEPDVAHPQGNNFASTERTPDVRLHELNNDERPQSPYGRFTNDHPSNP